MAQLFGGQAFDANAVEPDAPRDNLPPGDYKVMIASSGMKQSKDNAGSGIVDDPSDQSWRGGLNLEMTVLDGEFEGRKIWDLLSLRNDHPKTVEIAERKLSAICRAVGVWNCTDSEQLHDRAMIASVKVTPPQNGYDAKNEVNGYKPLAATQQAYTPAAQHAQPAAQPAATNSAPWRK